MAVIMRPRRRGREAEPATPERRGRLARLREQRATVAVAAVVLAFLLGVAVAPGGPGGLVLTSYHDQNLWALIPDGWKDDGPAAPYGSAQARWFDVANPQDSELVQAAAAPKLTPQAAATARAHALARLSGYRQGYLGPLTLAGGRHIWLLQYSLSGTDTAVFYYDACAAPVIAMTVTADASSTGFLAKEDDAFAQGAQPVCDGPAFSATDRADLPLPLTLPS